MRPHLSRPGPTPSSVVRGSQRSAAPAAPEPELSFGQRAARPRKQTPAGLGGHLWAGPWGPPGDLPEGAGRGPRRGGSAVHVSRGVDVKCWLLGGRFSPLLPPAPALSLHGHIGGHIGFPCPPAAHRWQLCGLPGRASICCSLPPLGTSDVRRALNLSQSHFTSNFRKQDRQGRLFFFNLSLVDGKHGPREEQRVSEGGD